MACFAPLTAWPSAELNPSGKRSMVFNPSKAQPAAAPVQLPCGQCTGCRLDYSKMWAVRLMHEAQLHDDACFITLTYSPGNLPTGGTLVKSDFTRFMKRLRKRLHPRKIRFYHCGEYGETTHRPHYHAAIFGFEFPDKEYLKTTDAGEKIYTSELLSDAWGLGFASVGALTFESAAYVARYMMKKQKGITAGIASPDIDWSTGEILRFRTPEYCTMSRKPGIAADWYEKYGKEVFPLDRVVFNGKEISPPRFYTSRYEIEDPEGYEVLKEKRRKKAVSLRADNTPDRLSVKSKVLRARLNQLKRGL